MKEELNVYGRTIGEEIETKYIRSDELEIRNTNTLQEDIKSSKLYEYVEDIYDKPTSSKFLKLTAYMALNIVKGICLIVLPMAAIAFLVFLCSKMGAYSLLSVNIPNTDIVSFSLSVTGFLIFILLGCFSVAIVAVDDFSIPLFFKVVVSVIVLALGILLMNTFMTANDFVSIFFPLFKFSFVLCFLFSALKLFAAFYFVKKK